MPIAVSIGTMTSVSQLSRSSSSPMLEARIDGIVVAVSCRRLDGAGARRSERTLGRAREGVTISYLSREACVIDP